MRRRILRLCCVLFFAGLWGLSVTNWPQSSGTQSLFTLVASAATSEKGEDLSSEYELPYGENLFAPSNAATVSGGFIKQEEFIPAARCAGCHTEAHAQWSESAHRNSFREPFYQTNVKHLIRDRKIAVTRHCESCHNPVALFSGALSEKAPFARPFDEEGVTCSVCHSIVSTNTTGIGSYVIDKPALLETADGTRLADVSDREILEDVPSHRRAMMRPLLKTPEFCAACHKAAVVPELNQRKWLRSFAIYDEWQQSAFSNETVQPLARRDRQSCQDCHMPEANGLRSHRWPGANTALPVFYNTPNQLAETQKLLQSGILSVDIFTLPGKKTDPETGSTGAAALNRAPRTLAFDVVVANRNVGHAFPAELRDIFEAWLEFKAVDADGNVLLHSGEVRPDGTLDASAHAYRSVPIDNHSEPITKHDIWNTRTTAFDRHIPPGRADLGRFEVPLPPTAKLPITVTARVNYRRFNKNFTDWVNRDTAVGLAPVTEVVSTVGILQSHEMAGLLVDVTTNFQKNFSLIQKWRAYGVALFDQQQFEPAANAFQEGLRLAAERSPEEIALNIDLAMTALRMERVGSSQETLVLAEQALNRALTLDEKQPRARFFRAMLNLKRFRYSEALTDLDALSREYPRDRQVWTQLGSLYLLQYRDTDAKNAYAKVLEIDPDDTEAHMKLTGLYWRFGMFEAAKHEQKKYNSYHSDNVAETLRRGYLKSHPEIFQTWPWREIGDNPIGSQP